MLFEELHFALVPFCRLFVFLKRAPDLRRFAGFEAFLFLE